MLTEQEENTQVGIMAPCNNGRQGTADNGNTDYEVSSTHKGENKGTNVETVNVMGSKPFSSIEQ